MTKKVRWFGEKWIRTEMIRPYFRMTAQVGRFGEKTREARLRWIAHVRRKDDVYIGRRLLRMELPGNRKRRWPNSMYMGFTYGYGERGHDSPVIEVTEEDAEDGIKWRCKIRCGDPSRKKTKKIKHVLNCQNLLSPHFA